MTDVVAPTIWQAEDVNGNPVAAAQAFFYRQGTTTPVTVYSDAAGSVAHPSPLVADSNGNFAPVFDTSSFNIRVDVKDPTSGASLPGYPVDFAALASIATSAASSVSFSPTSNIPQSNTQAAIEQVDNNWRGSKSGSDDNIISGTAGTNSNLAQWNGDGDLVDGPAVLDEDDMSSDSATAVPTQQSVKAYSDSKDWTYGSVRDMSTGAGEYDFTGIPSGVNRIEVVLDGVRISASSDGIRVRAMVSGADVDTGYTSGSNNSSATNGFLLDRNNGTDVVTAIMELRRLPGTNTWVASHSGLRTNAGATISGGGRIALAGEIDGIQIHANGSTFDLGQGAVFWNA